MQPTSAPSTYDIAIVGGGIVGLATARELLARQPGLKLAVIEKESTTARHQSGHNSGVLHTGIYYTPGSLKAKLCVAGHEAMIRFCTERSIPFDRCGKVIVAVDDSERAPLAELYRRGTANSVQDLELIDGARLREIEPAAAGVQAIYSPNTGIVDYGNVAQAYREDVQNGGGDIITSTRVRSIHNGERATLEAETTTDNGVTEREIQAQYIITCGGLHSDRLVKMTRQQTDVQIVPFRGDYYMLRPEKRDMVKGLIYPVPDPRFPFLGVHFTRVMNGEVWVGPNAVLAFGRESYRRTDFQPKDTWEVLSYRGFWRLASKYWRMGLLEMYRDYRKAAYLKPLQRYIPELQADDLLPGPSGIRAQALSVEGTLVDDFLIYNDDRVVHVQNAPSPAATSSLEIARIIVDKMQESTSLPNRRTVAI